MIKDVALYYLKMIKYCEDKENFNEKMFAMMTKNYMQMYKCLGHDAQGEVSYEIGKLNG